MKVFGLNEFRVLDNAANTLHGSTMFLRFTGSWRESSVPAIYMTKVIMASL